MRRGAPPAALRLASVLLVPLVLITAPDPASAQERGVPEGGDGPVRLEDVLRSVETRYPPLLAALVERDLAEGRLRGARGAFDLELTAAAKGTLDGYYEYTTFEAGAGQFLGLWGSTIYGGYRLTTGDSLPDYYPQRTQEDGEAVARLRIPLLRGGAVDPERAGIRTAELGLRAVDPAVARQRLDFLRAGTVAWAKWVAAGRKLELAREILRVAEARAAGLVEQVEEGLRAEISLVDNRRLVVAREIGVIEAEQAFLAASLTLSLFLRDAQGRPVAAGEARLPATLPDPALPAGLEGGLDAGTAVAGALERRPELAHLALEVERAGVELDLARNGLLPGLDGTLEVAGNFGEERYVDRTRIEVRGGLELDIPVQRRSARGEVEVADAKVRQARWKLAFAREQVAADVREAVAALHAGLRAAERAQLAAELAAELEAAERVRFREGSSDLLALQIREETTYEARMKGVEARVAFLEALADYRAAVAEGVEADGAGPTR